MKILYSTRLFSGLESSFINKKWNPTGVPTIYKLIEELDKKHDTKFIFSAKDSFFVLNISSQKYTAP